MEFGGNLLIVTNKNMDVIGMHLSFSNISLAAQDIMWLGSFLSLFRLLFLFGSLACLMDTLVEELPCILHTCATSMSSLVWLVSATSWPILTASSSLKKTLLSVTLLLP